MKTPNTSITASNAVLYRLSQILVLTIACLAFLDIGLRIFLPPSSNLWQKPVDIQTPETLYMKLDSLRQMNGVKIIVMGDSLAFGRVMRDHGDQDWQDHTLPVQLQNKLKNKYSGCSINIFNLGMNGSLPTDLVHLSRILSTIKPDLLLFDFGLRSFSRDFEDNQQTRPWLTDFNISEDGRYNMNGHTASAIQRFFVNNWYLYRIRFTVQALVFDGQPSAFMTRTRERMNNWFQKSKPTSEQGGDNLMLLLKARARYNSIDLDADNPQVQALGNLLKYLQTQDQPAIAFYATENPENLDDLIDRNRYEDLHRQLNTLMKHASNTTDWVGPLSIYKPNEYLDHVHINAQGYTRLSTYLLPLVTNKLVPAFERKGCHDTKTP
jgi:hypothetical protein